MTTGFIKSRLAAVDMPGFTLAAFTANREEVTLATSATAPLAGVVDAMGGKAGKLVDLLLSEIAPVRAGGAIDAGDRITADASGRAVKAVKQVGATVRVIGIAQEPAVIGDIFGMLVAPSAIDG